MPQAINQVIKEHYVKNSVKFEIIYNSHSLDVVTKTLRSIKELKDYRISKVNDDDTEEFELQHSGIALFDSFKHYQKFANRLSLAKNGPYEVNLLIYCADLSTELLASHLPNDHSLQKLSNRRKWRNCPQIADVLHTPAMPPTTGSGC